MTTRTPVNHALHWRDANADYLELHLRRLRALLGRRALWLRRQWGHDPRQEYAAQVISERHADWLLRGEDADDRRAFYATDPDALSLSESAAALEDESAELAASMGTTPPALDVLAHLFRLSDFERDVLLLCLAPEIDPTFAPLYAYLQDDLSKRAPTPHLAVELFGDGNLAARDALGETAPLRRYSLIQTMQAVPNNSAFYLDERIADYLRGVNRPDERLAPYIRPIKPGLLTGASREESERLATRIGAQRSASGEWMLVNLVGLSDSSQQELAQAICARLGIQLYRLDSARIDGDTRALLNLLEREAILLQVAFTIEIRDSVEAAQRTLIEEIAQLRQLLVFLSTREPYAAERELLTLHLARPDAVSSIDLWQQALGDVLPGDGVLPALVEQFDFGAQAITRVVAAARQQAQLENGALTPQQLWQASRDAGGGDLDELAQRLVPQYSWRELVAPAETLVQLHEIADQAAQRYTVYERWGFAARLSRGRGIAVLFAGPSGTGKTMSAEVLANHLNLALYRIDLASLISKYVGETEKNIRRVFESAEQRGAILFFDEADALFGKRTEVKDSHDRFANIEINYLLQRMESYWGLAILATNRRAALDRAFLRRLRFVVEFPFPDADSRRRIWQRVFPPDAPRQALDYDRLSRLEIAGGSIRNVALNAAFLAAASGEPITMGHILHAARREYAKIEKLETEAEFGDWKP